MPPDVHTRRSLTRRSFIAAAVALMARPARAGTVSTALVLASDVSSSVTAARFALQRQGYAAAFADPRVIRAIRETSGGAIAVCYFEWAGRHRQQVLVPWTRVADEGDGAHIAAILDAAPRPFDGTTGLGPAIDFAAAQLAACPFSAAAQVIDISGDGAHNDGDPPAHARDRAVARGIRVNGLPIRGSEPELPGVMTLPEYYESNVKGGVGAFVIEAASFESFGATLVAKLRREIA